MMTLTRFGFREWGTAALASAVLLFLLLYFLQPRCPVTSYLLSGFVVLFFFAFAAFFRNPVRRIDMTPEHLVSPADGTVRDIEIVDFDQAPFQGKALRIGIFLSVLNVHVNRAPADLEVVSVHYRKGEYLDARNAECAKRNEAMTIAGNATIAGKTFPMGIRQISGAIARRIVCPVQAGRKLAKGEVYGMIKFGSRTELYLPASGFTPAVKIGDKVKAGETILAVIDAAQEAK